MANAVAYKLRYRVLGSREWTTEVLEENEHQVSITSLLPGAWYEWKMKTLCQEGMVAGTPWSGIQVLQTAVPVPCTTIEECSCPVDRVPAIGLP